MAEIDKSLPNVRQEIKRDESLDVDDKELL